MTPAGPHQAAAAELTYRLINFVSGLESIPVQITPTAGA
jgi:hypothetical protein